MTRDLESALTSELQAKSLTPVLLSEFQFISGTIRFWTGLGDLEAMSQTFTGSGNLIGLSSYQETQELRATGIEFTLSGIPSSLLSIALTEKYQNQPCKLWLGCLNESKVLVSEPYQIFSGLMDVMQINEGRDTARIVLRAENALSILRRKKEGRYTPEYHKSIYNDDLGMDFVPLLQDREILWKEN